MVGWLVLLLEFSSSIFVYGHVALGSTTPVDGLYPFNLYANCICKSQVGQDASGPGQA